MSHRYRIAFRETLCSRKRGFYSSANGFVRDQSSFRETTIAAASRDHNLNYEGSQLVNGNLPKNVNRDLKIIFSSSFSLKLRTKSMLSSHHRGSRYGKDHGRLNSSIRWKENNNVKRVDSVKVSILSNLCKRFFILLSSLFCVPFFTATNQHVLHVASFCVNAV